MSIELPRPVIGRHDEDAESFVCRLAWANGFQCAGDLLGSGQPGSGSLRMISKRASAKLSQRSGVAEATIRRFAVAPGVIINFGESSIKRSQLTLHQVRFCPHCLRGDAEKTEPLRGGHQYLRGPWGWSMIEGCHINGCPLTTSTLQPSRLPSFRPLLRAAPFVEPSEPNEADVYFYGRLERPAGEAFLDGFPAYVAAEFCAILGDFERVLRTGAVRDRIPGGFEIPRARFAGYAIAKHGKDAVWDFLTTYVRELSRHVTRPRSLYSAAHHWWRVNKHNTDYLPLMKLLQEHAEQNVALDRGDTFFWPVLKRQVHTVRSASLAYGISEKRVGQILADKFDGDLPRFLKKDVIHRPLLDACSWLNTGEVAEIMGCSIEIVDQIIKAGFLTAVANTPEEIRIYRLVHRSEVEGLMAKVKDALQSVDGDAKLKQVKTLRWFGGFVSVLRLIIGGHLKKVYCTSPVVRLDSLHIDHAELRSVPRELVDHRPGHLDVDGDLIDLTAARRRLKTTKSVVDAIIAAGVVGHVRIENKRQWKGRSRVWVKTSDIDRFAMEHVSLDELAVERDVEPMALLAQLGRHGARPVIQGGRFVSRYYRRSDLPPAK
ncbi:TniQ family protein [Rhizobium mongolense]|uniref:TniQ family protein n=1 Tax=Rhizobium mongolense TaxID=57676 RepID=UPI0034A471E9